MMRLWRHILHSSCQWGCTPLDSPLACAGGHPQSSCQGAAPLEVVSGVERKDEFMEAHPPFLLPVGLHPSGLPWQRGWASLHAPLGGRRDYAIGGTSSIPPASGVAPLWTPRLHARGDTLRLLPEGGTHWTPACSTRRSNQGGRWLLPTHPPSSVVFQGDPPGTPGKEALPLCTLR